MEFKHIPSKKILIPSVLVILVTFFILGKLILKKESAITEGEISLPPPVLNESVITSPLKTSVDDLSAKIGTEDDAEFQEQLDHDRRQQQGPERVDMAQRVERQTVRLFGGGVAEHVGHVAVGHLVQRHRRHQRDEEVDLDGHGGSLSNRWHEGARSCTRVSTTSPRPRCTPGSLRSTRARATPGPL